MAHPPNRWTAPPATAAAATASLGTGKEPALVHSRFEILCQTSFEHRVRSATSEQPPNNKVRFPRRAACPRMVSIGVSPTRVQVVLPGPNFQMARVAAAPSVPPKTSSPSLDCRKGAYASLFGIGGPKRQESAAGL